MLSAHLTCASSCSPSSQCCPSPAVPVTPSLCPVLPPHSQLVLSCTSRKLPRICSLRGVRRGQQVPLCLSQGSHHAEHPSEKCSSCRLGPCPRSMVLMPCRDHCRAGNAPGIPVGEDGPRVYPQCFFPSTLHTARASPPPVYTTAGRREQGMLMLGWDGAGKGVCVDSMNSCPFELTVAAGIPPAPSGRGGNRSLGNVEESKIYLSAFFFPEV